MQNSMNEGCKWFGAIILLGTLAGLVAIGAWGALVFIAVGVPIVGLVEQQLRPELYPR